MSWHLLLTHQWSWWVHHLLRNLVSLDVLLSRSHSLMRFTHLGLAACHCLFWNHLLALCATHGFVKRRTHFARRQVRRWRTLLVELVLVIGKSLSWRVWFRSLLLSQKQTSLGLFCLDLLVLSLSTICLRSWSWVSVLSRIVVYSVGALFGQKLVVLHDGNVVFHFMLHKEFILFIVQQQVLVSVIH